MAILSLCHQPELQSDQTRSLVRLKGQSKYDIFHVRVDSLIAGLFNSK
jgi:hypothetical protein